MGKNVFPERNHECQQMPNIWLLETGHLAQLNFEWEFFIMLEDFCTHCLLRWYRRYFKPILSSSFSIFSSFQSENPPAKPHIATMDLTYQIHLLRFLYLFPKFPRQILIFIYDAAHAQRLCCVEDVFIPPLHKMHILGQANFFKWRYTMSLINRFLKVPSERGQKRTQTEKIHVFPEYNQN